MTERFEIQSQLGKGGMGVVWKARDSETGEIIALKLLHSLYVDDPDYVARFEREVEVSQRIVSPNVVRVLGYGKRDGVPYVAMEYVDGKSLREVVHERGPLPWDEAKPILRQIAEGLGAAHAAGVIHRDVKPSNIMIDSAGTVKLADFGIARAMDLTRMTGGVTMLGTPAYMSPDMETTEQSDLYGLGCVLYELLTGVPPFVADSQQQALMKHIREQPDLEKLPTGARKIAGWLLEKDPRKRPASAAALLGVLDGSSKITRTAVGVSSRWKPVLIVGGPGILALAGIVGLAAMFWGVGSPDEATRSAPVETATATSSFAPTLVSSDATTPTPPASPTGTAETTIPTPETTIATPTATSTKMSATATPIPLATATPTFVPTPSPTATPTSMPTPVPPTPTPTPVLTHEQLITKFVGDWRSSASDLPRIVIFLRGGVLDAEVTTNCCTWRAGQWTVSFDESLAPDGQLSMTWRFTPTQTQTLSIRITNSNAISVGRYFIGYGNTPSQSYSFSK